MLKIVPALAALLVASALIVPTVSQAAQPGFAVVAGAQPAAAA